MSEPCPRCDGEREIGVEVTCCTGSVHRIECGCGGQPVLEYVACPACAGGVELGDDDEQLIAEAEWNRDYADAVLWPEDYGVVA